MNQALEVVKPKQSNYDTYFIPQEVRDIDRGTPLYRLVSYWGMRKSDYICRDDIAQAFGISLRQASGLISSIYRKHEEVQCSLKRIKTGKGNVVKSYIRIHQILSRQKKVRSKLLQPNIPRKVREKQAQSRGKLLWAQLLTTRQTAGIF